MSPGPPRIFVLSSRPDIVQAVSEAAASLPAQPEVHGLYGRSSGVGPADLVLVDVAEPRATVPYLRRRFGVSLALVAMIEGVWAGRLGDALADDWDDYLFYPLSLPELGFVWTRHTEAGEAAELSLDVDEDGQIRAVIPADPAYQRPVVERMVEACRHLAGLDADATFRLRVALGEAVANAILYGSGPGDVVRIDASVEPARLAVRVADEGPGFDPASVPDPTTGDGIERSRGRGLFLLRKLCDEVRFNERGNEVTLTFRAALDPVFRLRAWMADYAAHTGLSFRLQREARGGAEFVFDGLAEGTTDVVRRSVGGGRHLVLEYAEGRSAEAAADLLAGVLAIIDESETARERIVERRMQRERVLAELEVARDLQLRLLPDPAEFADLAEVAARCEPALSLGGDFYFLARLPDRRLGVLLGDVSSHGPSAALIMALTLSTAAAATQVHAEPAAALDAMHDRLRSALASTEMYMTLFYGVLAPDTGGLVYANAGHPYAYRIGSAGGERLPALDPPIGMLEEAAYAERTTRLEPDETLLAFTDGLAERGDPFDDDGSPVRRLVEDGERSPRAVVAALFADGDDEVRLDDRTAVAVRRT